MARTRRRGSVIDKWSTKEWFTIIAPPYISEKTIGETVATESSSLIGRSIEIGLLELTDNVEDMQTKLRFKITSVSGETAETQFLGHEISRDFIRAQIRNHRTRIDCISDLKLKDNSRVRVFVTCITPTRCSSSQQRAIRKIIMDSMDGYSLEHGLPSFIERVLSNELKAEIYDKLIKIYPLKSLEIRKSKVLAHA
ncbi:MAG: 30S ribosomal protein S3ae [Candidatus Kariarchaeaceae archaeon]